MAIDKLITTRKEHTCTSCGEVIPKGSKAWYVSEKMPKYEYTSNDEEKQVGIDYFRAYFCFDKTANFECNSEGGIEIETMVPSCALDDVIAGEEQFIITDVSQRSELDCLHEVYKQCNVIEKCCDVCRCYKPFMPRILHFLDEDGNNVDLNAAGVNAKLLRDGTFEYFISYGFAGRKELTPVYGA